MDKLIPQGVFFLIRELLKCEGSWDNIHNGQIHLQSKKTCFFIQELSRCEERGGEGRDNTCR
jgi:hypothetical protein